MRAITIEFSPRRAEPMRSSRHSVMPEGYAARQPVLCPTMATAAGDEAVAAAHPSYDDANVFQRACRPR
jgi:hypothetical protein